MTRLAINLRESDKPISADLFGVFFEDLNYAADGGLYAELIQNRSFEYQATGQPSWNALTFWQLVKRGNGLGSWSVEAALPIHPHNPHYVVLGVEEAGDGVGIANEGFDGIPLTAGEDYDFSLFARQLYMNDRWASEPAIEGNPMPLSVRLETREGELLVEASLQVVGREWKRLTATLTPGRSESAARVVLLAHAQGGIALDEISLFPRKTFRERRNGLRADLAQVVADLKPRFLRFPGGCLVHGNGVGNFYQWKDTIGPVEERRGQRNLWGYHQSGGLGYFEYFQFCEDIGAKPVPVVPAGVSCQNSDHAAGIGQQCVPMERMPAYIQDVLDLIEWANGPITSTWGAKRAEAGHAEPFHLEYLGVGNEDHISPAFKQRFQMIHDALKATHPEITVIGTVGPFHCGEDFEEGWKFAHELKVPMVDEHYYEKPEWFLNNLNRYDHYDRSGSKVYLGEYAAHDADRKNTLRSALAEAAYMTQLERNGDVVVMASYAPLLARVGHTQWVPDLVHFTNTKVLLTINYHVQQLFGQNAGDTYLPVSLQDGPQADGLTASAVRDSQTGDLILKLVNYGNQSRSLRIDLEGAAKLPHHASRTMLTGDPLAVNELDSAPPLVPVTKLIPIGPSFDYEAPSNSLSVIRFPLA